MVKNYNDEILDEALSNGVEAEDIVTDVEAPASEVPQATIDTALKNATPVKHVEPTVNAKHVSLGAGIKDASVGGLTLSERAEMTKLKLAKEPKIMAVIPLDPGEKPGAVKTVSINGYRIEIKKNHPVELPKTVWELIMHNMKVSSSATASHPLNLNNADDERKKALGLV
jgi:hypothetical protein